MKKIKGTKKVKRLWRALVIFALFILLICIAGGVFIVSAYHYVERFGAGYIVEAEEAGDDADAIIVLGAKVSGGRPSTMLADRLDAAFELYKNNSAPKIIVSGDHGAADYNEVRAMRDYLVERGVPPEDIFMDHAGFNTYNSLYRARDVFLCKNPIIVTQQYHLVRALYIARGLGLEAKGVASDPRNYAGMRSYLLREYGSRPKAVLEVIFKVKPKYLGAEIPVWGSGLQTDDVLTKN